jgi:hypothetical protein
MRANNLRVALAAFAIALFTGVASFAQTAPAQTAPAQPAMNQRTVRFGVWDNSTNPNNVMTYELYEKDGSKLTVSNPTNPASDWSYVTLFDGVFRPVTGQTGAETAVEIIDAKSIRITNKRNGVVNQVVINTMTDENTISNEYIRLNPEGKIMSVSHVTYIRRKK